MNDCAWGISMNEVEEHVFEARRLRESAHRDPCGDKLSDHDGGVRVGQVDGHRAVVDDHRAVMAGGVEYRLGAAGVVDPDLGLPAGGGQFADRAGTDHRSAIHDDHVGTGLLHFGEEVARDQHGAPRLRVVDQHVTHGSDLWRVEAVGRFVQHHEIG